MKKSKNIFKDMSKAGVGLAGVGLVTGVGSSIATQAGVPMGSSFSTLASFAPIATTAYMGTSVLKMVKKKNKSRY
jgi:hypothetical protein